MAKNGNGNVNGNVNGNMAPRTAILSLLTLLNISNIICGDVVTRIHRIAEWTRHPQHPFPTTTTEEQHRIIRQLENDHDSDSSSTNGDAAGEEEETLPLCGDVLLHELPSERCHHALNCDGEYVMTTLLPLAFCNNIGSPTTTSTSSTKSSLLGILFPVLFPLGLILATLMLFRLLGSTAEGYFSPALEMISSEFRIVS